MTSGDLVKECVRRIPVTADAVEIWHHRELSTGFDFVGGRVTVKPFERQDLAVVRIYRDDKIGVAWCHSDDSREWIKAANEALAALTPTDEAFPEMPATVFPEPVSYDPALGNLLSGENVHRELVEAMVDNVHHEASRMNGLDTVIGYSQYRVNLVSLGRSAGCVSAISGGLRSELSFNDSFEGFHFYRLVI